jgi:hypothetical protein
LLLMLDPFLNNVVLLEGMEGKGAMMVAWLHIFLLSRPVVSKRVGLGIRIRIKTRAGETVDRPDSGWS